MRLLQRNRLETAVACGETIRAIAHKSAAATSSEIFYGTYGFADCAVKLEILARAAEAFGQPEIAATYREHAGRPDIIPPTKWPEYEAAVATRTGQMEDELGEYRREMRLDDSPVDLLREILNHPHVEPAPE
jgi:hypothetical protein